MRFERAARHLVGRLSTIHLPGKSGAASTLVVRSTSLGDFTVSLPFLATLTKQHPDIRLLLLTRFGNVGGMVLPHWADRCVVIDPASRRSTTAGIHAARAHFSGRVFDRVVYANNYDWASAAARRLAVIRAVVGMRPPIVGLRALDVLATPTDPVRSPRDIALNQALAPFVATGIVPNATRAECAALLALTDAEIDAAHALVRRLGGDPSAPAVAMYVNAKDERKRWPLERFVEVAAAVSRGSGRQIWLIGGNEDVESSRHVADALPTGHALVFAGQANVRTTLSLLSRCALFVGNDGAATHFAAIRGCPCVTVFCNWEVPGIWEPIAAPCSRSLRPVWSTARAHQDFGIATIFAAHVLEAVDQITARPVGHSITTIDDDGTTYAPGSLTVREHTSVLTL